VLERPRDPRRVPARRRMRPACWRCRRGLASSGGGHVASRSFGWKLLATNGPLNIIGISLLLAGVLKAL